MWKGLYWTHIWDNWEYILEVYIRVVPGMTLQWSNVYWDCEWLGGWRVRICAIAGIVIGRHQLLKVVNKQLSSIVQRFFLKQIVYIFKKEKLVQFRKFNVLKRKHIIPLLNISHEYWNCTWLCFGQCCGLNPAICTMESCFVHFIPWCSRCFRMAVEPLLRACLIDVGLWQQVFGSYTCFYFCPSFPLQICQDVCASITSFGCQELCYALPATADSNCGLNRTPLLFLYLYLYFFRTALLLSCTCHVFCPSDEKSGQSGRLNLPLDVTVLRLD